MADEQKAPPKIPARYIGGHQLVLAGYQGPHYDGNGNRLTSLVISPGDTLMMEQHEIRGMSYKFDPRGIDDPLLLGYGSHIVLPEHQGLPDEMLEALGYSFHTGRIDFEEIVPETQPEGQQVPAESETVKDTAPAQSTPESQSGEPTGASASGGQVESEGVA